MTVDKALSTLLETLDRIATSLEALVDSQGIVAGTVAPRPHDDPQGDLLDAEPEDDLEEEPEEIDDLDEEEEPDDLDEEPEPVKKKKTAKKKSKKKTAKKTRVGKPTADVTSKHSADEVRKKLQDLQLTTGSKAQPMSILKQHGASTFGQLAVAHYDRAVADIDKILDEYE